jgi:hypothetical protein
MHTLLFAKAVSHGNACEVRRSTYSAERRVHGETERETKPRKISHGTRESRWNSERKLRKVSIPGIWGPERSDYLGTMAFMDFRRARALFYKFAGDCTTLWDQSREVLQRAIQKPLNIRSDSTQVIKKAEFATLHRLHLWDRVKGQSSENSAGTIWVFWKGDIDLDLSWG